MASPSRKLRCTHLQYGLTHEQHDELIERSGNCCESCGCPARANCFGRLFIDHDWQVGHWAVRGLLCFWCNFDLGRKPDQYADFLAKSWYRQELAERGIAETYATEPPMGGDHYLISHKQTWTSDEHGWFRTRATKRIRPSRRISWTRFLNLYGPFNLVPTDGQPLTNLAPCEREPVEHVDPDTGEVSWCP